MKGEHHILHRAVAIMLECVVPIGIVASILAGTSRGLAASPAHPLDGLTEQECWTIRDVMNGSGRLGPEAQFVRVLLKELGGRCGDLGDDRRRPSSGPRTSRATRTGRRGLRGCRNLAAGSPVQVDRTAVLELAA
jgi:hypothetical protein